MEQLKSLVKSRVRLKSNITRVLEWAEQTPKRSLEEDESVQRLHCKIHKGKRYTQEKN